MKARKFCLLTQGTNTHTHRDIYTHTRHSTAVASSKLQSPFIVQNKTVQRNKKMVPNYSHQTARDAVRDTNTQTHTQTDRQTDLQSQ